MQAVLKINMRGDKTDLMMIERAGSTTATSNEANSEQGEPVNFCFFHSSFLLNFHISGEVHLK